MKPLIISIICLTIIDILQTVVILSFPGTRELNPIVRYFMAKLGSLWWLPKLAVTAVIIIPCAVLDMAIPLVTFLFVQLLAVIWNFYVLKGLLRGD